MEKVSGEEKIRNQTRQEWRELGFFYDYDEAQRLWRIVGSRSGIARLCRALRAYAADPRHRAISEHQHLGPYSDLEFVTWTEPKIESEGIYGRVEDFVRLADLVESRIADKSVGTSVSIDAEYAAGSENKLILEIAPDDFDPAGADPALRAFDKDTR